MKNTLPLLLVLAFAYNQVTAQTKIKDGTVTGSTSLPNAGAVLELESNNKGFLLPRVALTNTTTWGLTSSGVSGMTIYNTSTTITSTNTGYPVIPGGIGVYYWDGTGWVAVNPTAANGYYWQLTGNAGTNSGTNFLGTTDNHALKFKVNGVLAGYLDSASGTQNTVFGYGAGNGNYGNTAVGYSAGANNTGGHGVLVGVQAGYNNTGNYNHFVGYQAGYSNTSAGYNYFEGYQAGYSNTTGGNNQFTGYNAGYTNTTGNNNLYIGMYAGKSANSTVNQFIGYQAGQNATSGQYNMFEGYQAGGNTTTGNTNTFIGYQSGYTNTTGYNNTGLGFGTDMGSANLQNAAAIGFEAKVYTSNSMVLGDSSQAAANGVNHFAVNVGFGVYHPLKRIHIDAQTATNTSGIIADSLKIDNLATTPGSYNKAVLTIDSVTGYVSKINIGTLGAGQFWALTGNAGTSSATNFLGTTDNHPLVFKVNGTRAGYIDSVGGAANTFLGYQAGNTTTGYGNLYLGAFAGKANSSGYHNTVAGDSAALNGNTNSNVAIGTYAGYNGSAGGNNTAVGDSAAYGYLASGSNAYFGYKAGAGGTGGGNNTITGSNAGLGYITGSNNAMFGYAAGLNGTSGSGNTLIGDSAVIQYTGSNNSSLGYKAGLNNAGSNNTFVGTGADFTAYSAVSNAGALGYNAKVAASNSFVIGATQSTGNGINLGLGITSPAKRLDVDASNLSTGNADSLHINNLATTAGAYNKAVVTIDSTTGYVSKINIGTLGASQFWALNGNSGTNPGTNGLGGTATNYVGTADAQNLVLGTAATERMIIDQKGNAQGGGSGTSTTTGSNNFTWGLSNTIGTNNPRLSYAFGYNNTLNNSYPYVFVEGANHDIEGISTGAGAFGYGAKIYNSPYAFSFGTPGTFSSGTPSGYSIYNSQFSFLLGNNSEIYGASGAGYNFLFGQNNTINGFNNCVVLGGANVNAAGTGNMILTTGSTSTVTGGVGLDLTAVFVGGLRFFTGTGSTVTTTTSSAGQVMIMPSTATTSTAAPATALMGVGLDTTITSGTAGYTGKLNSTLQVGGSFSAPIRSISASATAGNNDFTLVCTAAITVTLPAVAQCTGRMYQIINYSTGSVSVKDAGSGSVMKTSSSSAAASASVTTNTKAVFQSDGTNWYQVQ